MRLASKIVCCAAIPVVLIAVTAGRSLHAIGKAGDASDEALSQVAPAVQEVASMQESLAALGRLHGRWIVLQDPAYADAWTRRMAVLEARLATLRQRLETTTERRRLAKAERSLARYRTLVAAEDGALRPMTVADRRRAVTAAVRARRAIGGIVREIDLQARRAKADAVATAERAWAALLFGAAVAGVVALALSSWVGRRVAVGLRRLAEATEALERGRLDQPVGVGGRDELGRVAIAFESLARELADRSHVADDTLHRLRHDLAEPLVTLRDATRVLAGELAAEPRQQQLASLIGDAADDLVHRVDRITEHPTAPRALEGPALTLLRAPLRMLPEPAPNDEERV
jgi:HAMP domain-containing protein